MGVLGLSNLVAFAELCGLDAGRLLRESQDGGLKFYSFAITGINLTADLVHLTRDRTLDEFYLRHGATPQSFQALYCPLNQHNCATLRPPTSPFHRALTCHPCV
jgi:hypothetical protein